MKELSLHILDIAQNSVAAHATLIEITIIENIKENLLVIKVKDNGIGMSKEFLEKVTDPFVTTRKTRKVGLGISLFKAAAERCNGKFFAYSELGKGTEIVASFEWNHIDRAPLGNMADTILSLIIANDQIDYVYYHKINERKFIFDTREIKKIIGELPLSDVMILDWIKRHIKEGLLELADA